MTTPAPILKDNRETKELELPSIPGSKVVVYTTLLAGDIERLLQAGQERSILANLEIIIKEWNLQDESGNSVPVNQDSLRLLTADDVAAIVKTAGLDDADFLAGQATADGAGKK